ncbi:MAG: hypothetical protein WC239_09425 [Sphaerochaetaceae bacterium]
MRKTDIERIIKQGSTRQKIKLYFTDVAYFNTKGMAQAELKGSGDSIRLESKDQILTDKERDLIFNSIKEPKDIKYWEELRTWNRAFLMFKPTITTYTKNFDYLTAQLSKYTVVRLLHKGYEDSINDILEVVEDEKLRETLVETALKSLNKFDAIRYQEEGFLPFIKIPEANNDKVWLLIEVLNEKIKEAKEYIEGIRVFLNKQLPLQPYKEFLKEAEDKIKGEIEECRGLIEAFTVGRTIETPLDKAIEVTPGLELPDERFSILRWEDVDVEVTDEDMEDIKRAGL